jgi:hypothetical protein
MTEKQIGPGGRFTARRDAGQLAALFKGDTAPTNCGTGSGI